MKQYNSDDHLNHTYYVASILAAASVATYGLWVLSIIISTIAKKYSSPIHEALTEDSHRYEAMPQEIHDDDPPQPIEGKENAEEDAHLDTLQQLPQKTTMWGRLKPNPLPNERTNCETILGVLGFLTAAAYTTSTIISYRHSQDVFVGCKDVAAAKTGTLLFCLGLLIHAGIYHFNQKLNGKIIPIMTALTGGIFMGAGLAIALTNNNYQNDHTDWCPPPLGICTGN